MPYLNVFSFSLVHLTTTTDISHSAGYSDLTILITRFVDFSAY